jgi:hypothetical protein
MGLAVGGALFFIVINNGGRWECRGIHLPK